MIQDVEEAPFELLQARGPESAWAWCGPGADLASTRITTTASRSTAQDYALPDDWQRAPERLALLAACHDPATFRRAQALGVDAGWSCLEGGANADQPAPRLTLTAPNDGTTALMRVSHRHRA